MIGTGNLRLAETHKEYHSLETNFLKNSKHVGDSFLTYRYLNQYHTMSYHQPTHPHIRIAFSINKEKIKIVRGPK